MLRQVFLLFMLLVGAFLAYLSLEVHTLSDAGLLIGPSSCTINEAFDCTAVYQSSYSRLFGFSLGAIGLLYYLSFVLALIFTRSLESELAKTRDRLMLAVSSGAVLFSLYLLAVSVFILQKKCIYCFGMYGVNFLVFGAFALSASESFLTRFLGGIRDIFKLPRNLLSAWKGESRSRLVIALGSLLLSVILVALLPKVFVQRAVREQKIRAQASAILAERTEKTLPFNLELGGGIAGDYYLGNPSAKVVLVEFADFECPSCRYFLEITDRIHARYGDQILFVFKNYPLDQACNESMNGPGHRHACFLAEFTRCAGEQGKFWDGYHRAFQVSTEGSSSEVKTALFALAAQDGLDTVGLKECLSSDRQLSAIKRDIYHGDQVGLLGTPTLLVNGHTVSDKSFEAVSQLIDSLLSED